MKNVWIVLAYFTSACNKNITVAIERVLKSQDRWFLLTSYKMWTAWCRKFFFYIYLEKYCVPNSLWTEDSMWKYEKLQLIIPFYSNIWNLIQSRETLKMCSTGENKNKNKTAYNLHRSTQKKMAG